MAADVVDLADSALMDDQVDGSAVILHIEPVTDIQSLAVDRQRLVIQRVGDHQRDQLLREMVGAVIVGAAADADREPVGPVVGQDQKVRCRLGRTVGAAGMDRRLLSEKQVRTVQRQVTVDLVRGDLMIAGDTVLPAGIHQSRRAHDVGLQENARILDGAVHVGLRGEIHHNVRMLLLKQLIHCLPVADVCLHKAEVRLVHHRLQRGKVSRICQLVQAHDPVIRMSLHHMENKVGADKPGAAGHDNRHIICCSFLSALPGRDNNQLLFVSSAALSPFSPDALLSDASEEAFSSASFFRTGFPSASTS